jgi:hypothetical protein
MHQERLADVTVHAYSTTEGIGGTGDGKHLVVELPARRCTGGYWCRLCRTSSKKGGEYYVTFFFGSTREFSASLDKEGGKIIKKTLTEKVEFEHGIKKWLIQLELAKIARA